jgi:hypothetical protein
VRVADIALGERLFGLRQGAKLTRDLELV